jgi:hypothetical protein
MELLTAVKSFIVKAPKLAQLFILKISPSDDRVKVLQEKSNYRMNE